MTREQAIEEFQSIYIGLYINKVDYWTAQLAWSCFTDSLCRDGHITMKQYQSWVTPFKYGKRLKATNKMLRRWCYA